MDASLTKEKKELLKNIVLENKEIKKIDEIYSAPIGYHYIVVLTIYVDGKMSTEDSHAIADQLEDKIVEKMDAIKKAIIHVNPI